MTWYKRVRETGLIEIVCPHGVGHPSWWLNNQAHRAYAGIHGCEGCCATPEFVKAEEALYAHPLDDQVDI